MRNTSLKMKSTLPNNSKIIWSQINWLSINRYVEKMQQRIYHAESLGKKRKVRELQRLLMHSKSVLLTSIKRITQINNGKKTSGIDGYTALTDYERNQLYNQMVKHTISQHNPKASLRTYIKKKNGKLRPLSIPTIRDRIWQNIAKMALEPQWEVRFESTSYGFRPQRSCHDAIERIFKSLARGKKQWIFEGDFKGCFDNLKHDYIMKQIREFPQKTVIKKWLNSGYIDNNAFCETTQGSGQGSVISPLLANIALHGMEEQLEIKYKTRYTKDGYKLIINQSKYTLVRYADDFACMCQTKEDAEAIYNILKTYLKARGLELEPSKTRVVKVSEGFDFLGFNIKRYQTALGEKLLIKPSKEAVKKCKKKISEATRNLYGTNVEALINKLNPIIIGTANYWSPEVSKKVFSAMDKHIFTVTYGFLKRLHPKKSIGWINAKYYKTDIKGISKNRWILTAPTKPHIQLKAMSLTLIKRHTMIRHNASPYDVALKSYYNSRKNKQKKQDFGEKEYLSCMS